MVALRSNKAALEQQVAALQQELASSERLFRHKQDEFTIALGVCLGVWKNRENK